MKTAFLSSLERERGTRAYQYHAFFNGLGFTLVADTTVALMAINLGATNTQLGYIGSALNLSGLVLPFVPVLFAGMNIGRLYSLAWTLRGLVCALYFALPFVSPPQGLAILIGTYTVFCLTRAVGAAMAGPVQLALSTRATLGRLIARQSYAFSASALCARAIAVVLTRVPVLAGMRGLLALEALGMIANTASSNYLGKLGVRDVVERANGLSVFGSFQVHVRRRGVLRVLVLNWLMLLAGIMFSFTIPFLKRSAGMSESTIFIYSVATGLAAIAAAVWAQPFTDRMGGGPMLFVSSLAVAASAVVWAFISPGASPWVLLGLGFLTALVSAVAGLVASRMVVSTMPEHDKVSYTAMYSFVGALVALGGGVAGGALTDLGALCTSGMLHPYSFAYLAAAALTLACAVGALGARDDRTDLRETAGILFSPRNLRDFIDIYQLDSIRDPVRRETILASIEQSDTTLATAEIGSRLKSPLTGDRERALKSLFAHPRPELLDSLLAEAADPHSHTRATAIFALGAYRDPRVEAALLAFFAEPSDAIRATASKSLARIGVTSVLDQVREAAERPHLATVSRIDYAIALTLMDREGTHLRRVFELAPPELGFRSAQAVLSTYARFLELSPALAVFFHRENIEQGSGFGALLEEARVLAQFLDFERKAEALFEVGSHAPVWIWCREQLRERQAGLSGPPAFVAEAIDSWDLTRLDDTNTLTAAYFTYQILHDPKGWGRG